MTSNTRQASNPKIILICVALIAVIGFAVYFNSLGGKFVWDDFLLVKQYKRLFQFADHNVNIGYEIRRYIPTV